jgi:type IX secretion system PorP/SprF family membrane protein
VVSKPYQTLSASLDAPIIKRKFQRDVFSLGIILSGDRAGDSEYGTTSGELSLSYIKALGRSNRFFWGFGLRGGYTQRTINYEKLSFDVQYNGFFYDSNLPIGEHFTVSNINFVDFAVGTHIFYQSGYDENFKAGYSLTHPGQPDISFLGDNSVRLPMKHCLYIAYEREIAQHIYLQPSIHTFLQDNFREILIGANFKHVKITNPDAYQAFYYGLHTRTADAAVAFFGFDHRKMHMGFSYDINYSLLRRASYGLGGFEISVCWLFNRSKVSRIKMVPCPMF